MSLEDRVWDAPLGSGTRKSIKRKAKRTGIQKEGRGKKRSILRPSRRQ